MARDYARALAKAAVAQIAESIGFDSIQQSAHEALAEMLLQYISEIGSLTHGYTEIAGRTDCNVNDVLLAFQDLGINVQEVIDYADGIEDVPFAHSIAEFPVSRKPANYQTFAQKGEEPPEHIPSYLPAFPEKHTYLDTPRFASHTKDPREQKLAVEKARKEAEKALVKLADRVKPAAKPAEKPQGRSVEGNPFLAPPEMEEAPAEQAGGEKGAAPMQIDQLPTASAGQAAPWTEAVAAEEPGRTLENPLTLDWTLPVVPRTQIDPVSMGFEDAFANIVEDARDTGGRRRKLSLKARAAGDPASQRAEQILAAGAEAMAIEEAAEKQR